MGSQGCTFNSIEWILEYPGVVQGLSYHHESFNSIEWIPVWELSRLEVSLATFNSIEWIRERITLNEKEVERVKLSIPLNGF